MARNGAVAARFLAIAIWAGTDVAMESAGVVLAGDDPRSVLAMIDPSEASYRKMIQNLVRATGYNLLAMPLAAGVLACAGFVLSPAVGAVLMSVSTIVVALNAQLLRRINLSPERISMKERTSRDRKEVVVSPEGIFATSVRRSRPAKAATFLAGAALLLSGCSVQAEPESPSIKGQYPSTHVHGMSVDPGTNRVLLATHDGLFNVSASSVVQVGPTIDLMGFTQGPNGDLYASGHPGPGAGLPDPVGLIRSTDGGRTWQPLSLQGESDFHALAATSGGFVGFDGQLRTSPDGTSWEAVEEQIPAYNLAGAPRGEVVLATTEEGLQRSTDHGKSWTPVPDAPLLMFTSLSEGQAAGITPDGEVYTSDDEGLTWEKQGTVPGEVGAIASQVIEESVLRVWVATEDGVQVSNDNGRTFADIRANRR